MHFLVNFTWKLVLVGMVCLYVLVKGTLDKATFCCILILYSFHTVHPFDDRSSNKSMFPFLILLIVRSYTDINPLGITDDFRGSFHPLSSQKFEKKCLKSHCWNQTGCNLETYRILILSKSIELLDLLKNYYFDLSYLELNVGTN